MRRAPVLIVTGLAAVIALAALAFAATRSIPVRQFALDAPDQQQVAVLRPHHATVCEGPVSADGPVDAVDVWGAPVPAVNRLRVDVRDASSGTLLASGARRTTHPSEYLVALDHTIPAGRMLRVCLTSTLDSFSVLGSQAVNPALTAHPAVRDAEFSLNLVRLHSTSLLGSLGLAFGRASLFRPSWVGAWTFWLLLVLVLGAFTAVAVAVVAAAGDDDDGDADSQAGSSDSTARQ